MKPSGIGGMAVMEGVMMKNKEEYAVAVRKPDNEIVVEKSTYRDISDKVKLFKLPIFRGMLAFVDSMVIGVKVLNYSSSFFEEEEETDKSKKKASKKDSKIDVKKDTDIEFEDLSASDNVNNQKKKNAAEKSAATAEKNENNNTLLMVFAVLLSIVLSVALFMVLPVLITNLFSRFVTNKYLMAFIEGILRLAIFIGYVILAAKMPEIKRVFMYHGAEHKTINCLENGFELTVENVRWQSKQHKRCGTSFMLLVILISLIFFIALPVTGLLWRVVSRIILVPFIAGVSYEFIRLAGRSESRIVDILSKPGLWMQGLTTKEPDDSMIEVAIESVGAVFDWRAFLETSAADEKSAKSSVTKNIAANKSTANKNTANKNTANKSIANKNTTNNNTGTNKAQVEEPQTSKKEIAGKQSVVAKSAHNEKRDTSVEVKTGSSENNMTDTSVKPASGTVKESVSQNQGHQNLGRSHTNNAPSIAFKPSVTNHPEDEDDEILKALDKFFDEGHKDGKSGEK